MMNQDSQPAAFAIEVADLAAGLALREGGGFRFVATDRRFQALDGTVYRRLDQLERAARRLAQTEN